MNDTMHATPRRQFLGRLAGVAGAAAVLSPATQAAEAAATGETATRGLRFHVRDFGAAGDGVQLDTRALQTAIDACARSGGGTVWFSPGRYLTGTLQLKSQVLLRLDAGAVLLGSRNLEDYPVVRPATRSFTDRYTKRALLFGDDLEQIGIVGEGLIDGQGAVFKIKRNRETESKTLPEKDGQWVEPEPQYGDRPYLIRFANCRGVRIQGVTLKDSAMWVQHYLACDDILIDGITVRSRCNANNDGIDIDGCSRVRINNCDIHSGDDAIVLKSTLNRPCRDIVITNCVLSSDCNAFKTGTESNGGFQNITLSNCVFYDTHLSGLALELVDGGLLDGLSISNITMRNVQCPIFLRLGNRARPFQPGQAKPAMGAFRNVKISHIMATGANSTGCSITGLPGSPVENVAMEDIQIQFAGGGTEDQARRAIPEMADAYPEYRIFGPLPAYGFFCRHARNLRLSDFDLSTVKSDQRPALVCEDITGLDLDGWRATLGAPAQPLIHFKEVRQALVHRCRCPENAPTFLQVDGSAIASIKLLANDLPEQPVRLGEGTPAQAVVVR